MLSHYHYEVSVAKYMNKDDLKIIQGFYRMHFPKKVPFMIENITVIKWCIAHDRAWCNMLKLLVSSSLRSTHIIQSEKTILFVIKMYLENLQKSMHREIYDKLCMYCFYININF